jgi:hypothetical protein
MEEKRMRSWMMAGAVGLSLVVVAAASAQTQFNVILSQSQVVGSSPVDLTQATDLQVVAGTGGQVGLLGADNEGNQTVLYYDGSAWTSVIQTGDSVSGNTVQQFANLALSGNAADGSGTRLTFLGINSDNNDAGVFQYDVGGAGVQEVAFDGKNGLTIPSSYGTTEGFMPIAVDQAGNVAFEPLNASGDTLVDVGNISSMPVVTTAFTSDSNSDGSVGSKAVFGSAPLGISTDATGATTFGVINSPASNTHSQFIATFSGGTATVISGAALNDVMLLAAQQNASAGVNAALYEAQDPSLSNIDNVILYNNGTNHILQSINTNTATGGEDTGEMTIGGKMTYYVPTSAGGALEYYDVASNTYTPTQVAAVGSGVSDPFVGGSYVIKSLPTLLQSPMINNNGLVVFDATIGLSGDPSSSFQALLDWTGSGSPTVLLYAGENIAGQGNIDPDGIIINGLFNQADVFKDSLNDQGYLNVVASFDDGTDLAVLQTAVPEPTTLAMLPIVGALLLRRRNRAAS